MIYDDPRLDEFKRHLLATGSVDVAWVKVFGDNKLCNCRELQAEVKVLAERLQYAQSILDDVAQEIEAAMDLLRTPLE